MKKLGNQMEKKRMNKVTAIIGAAAIAAGFVGCTPDKVIVTIPTSAVQKSQAGEVGYASAKITYSVMDNDGKKHLAKCKEVAAKFVGEGGTVDLSGGLDPADSNPAYLTATFMMPICTPQNKDKVKFVPPAVLWLENGALTFNACVKRLNEELKKINDSIKAEYDGGETIFRLVGDSGKPIQFGVFGTFLNKKPVVSVGVTVEKGKQYEVLYHRSADHIWHEIDPFVNIMK